ncbi:hypothetical protein DERF_002750 [Dermatophagoides farinae]|uniref:Uncharacterized protein n=1 Tax=Dermatophagoides farinae TaxID=6954 RepID=A0A922LAT3_DERFA|nr:hypothetical protein DERF_002750 [Dermatophagoides farinae]
MVIRNELDTTDESMFQRLKENCEKEILAGYISCTNLPLKKQTKRDNIYLFLMVKRPSTRIFEAMNQILKPFVDEMKLLEKTA